MDHRTWPLPIDDPTPAHPLRSTRDGRSPLERAALRHLERELASFEVRWLARLALWPGTVAAFAGEAGIDRSQVYNMLARRANRPYRGARRRLALYLGLSEDALDLVDRPRREPGRPAPENVRDGGSELERLALRRVRENLAALPAGLVLQLVTWPFSEKELAEAAGVKQDDLYNMLAALRGPYHEVRDRISAFLGVEREVLDHLVDAEAGEPAPR